MKLVITNSELSRALQFVRAAVAKKNATIRILTHVRLETRGDDSLSIAATDLNLTAMTEAEAAVSVQGGCTVDAESLATIVKNSSAPIAMHAERGRLIVTTGSAKYELPALPLDDYPTLPSLTNKLADFSPSEFLPALRSCTYAMNETDAVVGNNRVSCDGAHVAVNKDRCDIFVFDGSRMALASIPGRHDKSGWAMLPRAVVEASKHMNVRDSFTLSVLTDDDGKKGLALGSDVLIGTVPDNAALLRAYSNPIEREREVSIDVATADLVALVAAVSPFGHGERRTVALSFKKGLMRASGKNEVIGNGAASIAIEYSGEPFCAGFTSAFLSDPLATITTKTVNVRIDKGGEHQSLLLTPVDSSLPFNTSHVVMSMKLAWEPEV